MTERLYGLLVFKKSAPEPILLAAAIDTSSFPLFQRNGVKQFMTFISRTAAKDTKPNTRQQFVEDEYRLYAHARDDGLVCCVAANKEYKERVAFTICNTVMSDFSKKFEPSSYANDSQLSKSADGHFNWKELKEKLKLYQDPTKACQILQIQKDLEDVQTLMMQNLDKVLERGDKMSDLVERSSDLTSTSKTFYKTAKKTNKSCCTLM
eukprot:TRINITY_DN14385_c0_g1_i1.p1 TRINITY_DN14385_c0_g1~~TRINITY_DN14385_c0_g1_i1.p1  ORF type:complete len:208 (+),score=37.46 TRINITY_DN14385_c0_g1_i1:53-676(+)